MKKSAILAILLAFGIFASFASAAGNFSEQAAYDWLVNKAVNGNYGSDIFTTSLAGLALKNVGYEESAKASANWVLSQKDAQNCFPKGDCKTKETAMALMLLNSMSMPETAEVQKWLEESQSAFSTSGKWLLEISTQATGKCEISYQQKNKTIKDSVDVDKGKFPKCGDSNFMDIDSCFKPGLIRSEPGLKLTVDCSALTGETPIITLVYNTDTTYYIVNTELGSVADVVVANGCYGKTARGPCNKDSSLYSNWALKQLNSASNINLYLLESYDAASIADNSLLYLSFLTKNDKYLEALKTRQSADGSFSRDPYQTALAVLALRENSLYGDKTDKAKEWLKSKQGSDGSWNDNPKDTAMILYSAFSDAVLKPEAVKEAKPEEKAGVCNYNFVCEAEAGETPDGCTDCAAIKKEEICNINDVCDTDNGETAANCVDCKCGDNTCDSSESFATCSDDCKEEEAKKEESICGNGVCESDETPESCQADCKKAGVGFGTILLIIVLVALLGVGAYLAYSKLKKPAQKAPSPFGAKPGYVAFKKPQAQQAKPATKPSSESELQRSLEEARKLLRK